jgi:glycosyltransferase involved in cell wall biosynthesis
MKEDIIHIISSLLVGGAERFVLDLARQQQIDGYKVLILNLGSTDDPLIEEALNTNVPVLTIPTKRVLAPNNGIIKRLCHAKAVHAHNAVCIFRICAYIPFLNGSLIYTRHSERNLSSVTKLAHVLAKYKVKAITFVSEGSKNSFYKQFNWPNIKSLIIDNGVFIPENEPPYNLRNQNIKIITIGRMVPLKRQADLIEAVSRIEPSTQNIIELHFYGDGELRQELEVFSKKLNVNAIFHGMELNREKIYSQASIVTCMSETEGLSIALLESMAWSIPIIATDVGGNPKCVVDGNNGFLYKCGQIEELKSKLITLIENKERRIEMGRQGKKRAQKLFSIKQTAKEFYDCYWN